MIRGTVKIGSNCRIGPFAHLRDGTVIDDGVEVGAFVEIKQSHLGKGTIARHLAYLGDAEVGEGANIGATAITANYRRRPQEQDRDRRPQPDRRRRNPGRARQDRPRMPWSVPMRS